MNPQKVNDLWFCCKVSDVTIVFIRINAKYEVNMEGG